MKLQVLLLLVIALSGSVIWTPLQGVDSMEQIQKEHEQKLLHNIAVGSVYEHYSGKRYRVIAVGRHSEDLSLYVVYEALYDCGDFGQTWLRPLAMFLENVEITDVLVQKKKKID